MLLRSSVSLRMVEVAYDYIMWIHQVVPDAEALLALDPEELAWVLMVYLNSLPANERHVFNMNNHLSDPFGWQSTQVLAGADGPGREGTRTACLTRWSN